MRRYVQRLFSRQRGEVLLIGADLVEKPKLFECRKNSEQVFPHALVS